MWLWKEVYRFQIFHPETRHCVCRIHVDDCPKTKHVRLHTEAFPCGWPLKNHTQHVAAQPPWNQLTSLLVTGHYSLSAAWCGTSGSESAFFFIHTAWPLTFHQERAPIYWIGDGGGEHAVIGDYVFLHSLGKMSEISDAGWRLRSRWKHEKWRAFFFSDSWRLPPPKVTFEVRRQNSFPTLSKCVGLHMWIIHQWIHTVHQLCIHRKQFQSHALNAD